MKAGIITDSHDHHANVLEAIEIFKREKVEVIFHAGDIVSPFTAKAFEKVGAQFIAVYGNNDGEKLYLNSIISGFGGEIHPYCYKGRHEGKSIYMTHTQHDVDALAASQFYDVIVYGHTHQQDIRREGRTLIINPGESTDWLTGRGRVVILDLSSLSYEIISL